jgi:hypothetical protein
MCYWFLTCADHWSDIQTTTILVFLTLNVITFLASHIVMALVQDMYHIIPESIARRLKITGKTLSTSTLAYQAIGLASTTALLVVPLGFLTAFVFTKEANVLVIDNGAVLECPIAGTLNDLCLRTVYDETPYSKLTVLDFLWNNCRRIFALFSPNQCRAALDGCSVRHHGSDCHFRCMA